MRAAARYGRARCELRCSGGLRASRRWPRSTRRGWRIAGREAMRRLSVGQSEPDRLHQALAGDVGAGRRVAHEFALGRLEDAEDEVVGGEEQAAQISDRLAFPAEPGGLVPGGSRSGLELALVDAGPVALGRVEHAASRNAPYGWVPQSMYRGITLVIRLSSRSLRPSRRIVASAYLSPF